MCFVVHDDRSVMFTFLHSVRMRSLHSNSLHIASLLSGVALLLNKEKLLGTWDVINQSYEKG